MTGPIIAGLGWTDERVDLLKKLWQDGLSANQIARQLGSCSRNSVIGKVHRLGLAGRASPSKPTRTVAAPTRPAPTTRAQAKVFGPRSVPLAIGGGGMVFEKPAGHTPTEIIPFREEGPGLATIHTLGAHMCKWPIGSPDKADFTFCGQKRERGSYCTAHADRGHLPAKAPKPRLLRRYL